MSYRVISFALWMLVMFVPVQAEHFGHGEPGPLTSQGLTANSKRGSKFTPPEPGTVNNLCAYMDGMGGATGTQEFRLALYSDPVSNQNHHERQPDEWKGHDTHDDRYKQPSPLRNGLDRAEQAIALPCARAPRAAQSQRWWV
jgi:hypothetical protein